MSEVLDVGDFNGVDIVNTSKWVIDRTRSSKSVHTYLLRSTLERRGEPDLFEFFRPKGKTRWSGWTLDGRDSCPSCGPKVGD